MLTVIMIVVFGSVYSVHVKVGVYGYDVPAYVKDALSITAYDSVDSLLQDMHSGKLDVAITPTSVYAKRQYKDVAPAVYMALKGETHSAGVVIRALMPSRYVKNTISFYITGMLAMAIINSAIFSVLKGFAFMKEGTIGKKLMLTGFHPKVAAMMYTSVALVYAAVNVFIYYVLAYAVYGVHMRLTFSTALTILLILFAGVGFGAVIYVMFGGRNAIFISSSLLQLLMFFSGVYFPVSLIPRYLKFITYLSPPYYGVSLLRYTALGVRPPDSPLLYVSVLLLMSVVGAMVMWMYRMSYES